MQLLSAGSLQNLLCAASELTQNLCAASELEYNLLCAVLKVRKVQNLLYVISVFGHNLPCECRVQNFTLQIPSKGWPCLHSLLCSAPRCKATNPCAASKFVEILLCSTPGFLKTLCILLAKQCRTYCLQPLSTFGAHVQPLPSVDTLACCV